MATIHVSPNRVGPPTDALKAVFSPSVRARLANANDPDGAITRRLGILTASGPYPNDIDARMELRVRRAIKAAWEVYLQAAFAVGMLAGERGTDVIARLTQTDEEGFRSALCECLAAWFLAGRMRLSVDGNAVGRQGKRLDMAVVLPDGRMGVEVKAPYRSTPDRVWCGDDADKISQCIDSANRQFDDKTPNLLVLVPQLRTSMYLNRHDIVKAAYGETVIKFDLNKKKGRLENRRLQFSPRGKFLSRVRPGGRPLKPDGFPAFRRVSAVLCIEERRRERDRAPENAIWMDHDVLVLHNPYAYHPISSVEWDEFPQLICDTDGMRWTDGHEVVV